MARIGRRTFVVGAIALLLVGVGCAIALHVGGAQLSDILMALFLPSCAIVAGTWFDALRGSRGRDPGSRSKR